MPPKPSREIFQHVLDTYGLKAEESIFIDDSIVNIRGAQAAGIPRERIVNALSLDELLDWTR